ncbi:hypothetical protein [Actinokineospora globicatena]|uniref:Excreted virulence factor EspC, type VII ESX diderm n=1 Tax=Actinokineospora globicatena TaxID=103729 RepID=A0A9W6V552_9PSEU|nr:hypothetical protein [Actinokineospora globicatena]MCP2303533.1 Excreted virulence factor EspC, type VII ESX diderm [Actinokineospora globicatena]GLW79330.1 hypothetical protein Aglo01_38120 [Actinokineospora globicatena]GLW86260.1 hypothetical protein Aglo02_38990 [Actinokineospora globicatena]GLW89960.1 hypothetical protein Aglo03_07760 [Actinokineospora globicatena]
MTGFDADLGKLTEGAAAIDALSKRTEELAVQLQGACAAPPRVGDVQATAVYQQAHFDWAQTRFEDLAASETELAGFAAKLRETAATYRGDDTATARALGRIIGGLR